MNYLRISLFTLALIGLLISAYLFSVYVWGGPILCNGSHGCETVRASAQAKFFGVPTPAYGMLFYVVMATLAWLVGVARGPWLKYALLIWGAGGLAASTYLTYIEAFVIEAWCVWCVGSAIVATLIFLLVWLYQRALLPGDEQIDRVKTI